MKNRQIPLLMALVALLLGPVSLIAQTTSIGGVVNQYARVTGIYSASEMETPTPGIFIAGDLVLVIQMRGALAENDAASSAFGTLLDYQNAGHYEFARVQSVGFFSVAFEAPLTQSYSADGSVQLVKVPEYKHAVVGSPLTAMPWNGNEGGIVCVKVDGTLTLMADINVAGKGFRGGFRSCHGPFSVSTYASFMCEMGWKGEGVSDVVYGMTAMGRAGNGGGGGHYHNAGGGGGSNCGSGGAGWEAIGLPGLGGQALDNDGGSRLFMGGGGGGGNQNNNRGQHGANGGGIIIVYADEIIGNGHSLIADGANSLPSVGTNNDGGGGGGGGGSVLVQCNDLTGGLTASAKGGSSAAVCCSDGDNIHGAGGGGGGGLVWHSGSAPWAGFAHSVNGGVGYLRAEEGNPGCVMANLFLPFDPCASTTLAIDAGDDAIVYAGYAGPTACTTLNATPSGGTGPYSLLWSTGATTASISVCPGASTTYSVTVTDALGCTSTDEVQVCAINVSCGTPSNPKVAVCHIPPGNPDALHTICVGAPAVPAHLAHGDYLGPCGAVSSCFAIGGSSAKAALSAVTLTAAPNPFQQSTLLSFSVAEEEEVSLSVMDVRGQTVATLWNGPAAAGLMHQVNFDASTLPSGIYFVQLSTAHGTRNTLRIAHVH